MIARVIGTTICSVERASCARQITACDVHHRAAEVGEPQRREQHGHTIERVEPFAAPRRNAVPELMPPVAGLERHRQPPRGHRLGLFV
jgi:hypothetical protein